MEAGVLVIVLILQRHGGQMKVPFFFLDLDLERIALFLRFFLVLQLIKRFILFSTFPFLPWREPFLVLGTTSARS